MQLLGACGRRTQAVPGAEQTPRLGRPEEASSHLAGLQRADQGDQIETRSDRRRSG